MRICISWRSFKVDNAYYTLAAQSNQTDPLIPELIDPLFCWGRVA